jgi:hypothetical protein
MRWENHDNPDKAACDMHLCCSACSAATHVLDSRPAYGAVRRRRECLVCGERFTTWERVEADGLERTVLAYVRNLSPTTEEMTPHG